MPNKPKISKHHVFKEPIDVGQKEHNHKKRKKASTKDMNGRDVSPSIKI